MSRKIITRGNIWGSTDGRYFEIGDFEDDESVIFWIDDLDKLRQVIAELEAVKNKRGW